ncbi:MAG: hypothetical protein ACRDT4_07930 [Micromonosporaceae bacterium]
MAETTTSSIAEATVPEQAGAAPIEHAPAAHAPEQSSQTEPATPPEPAEQTAHAEPTAPAEPAAQPESAEAPAREIVPEPLRAAPGLEGPANTWWAAVHGVHRVLLEEADIETVGDAFRAELIARWEYALALHEGGFQVPDYLAERAAVAPLWPLPQQPASLGELTKAA